MKFVFFRNDGTYINEKKFEITTLDKAILLKNGNYLVGETTVNPSSGKFLNILSLYDSNLKKLKEVDKHEFENPLRSNRILGIYQNIIWNVSKNKIYTGHRDQIYEIRIFNLTGDPIRIIRKKYKKVPLSEEYKKKYMKQFASAMFEKIKSKFYFPRSAPAYHSFITDERGRIFVMTYEPGSSPGNYVFDIFNDDGILILRKELPDLSKNEGINALIRYDRLYCVKETSMGYQKFFCYKIKWKY